MPEEGARWDPCAWWWWQGRQLAVPWSPRSPWSLCPLFSPCCDVILAACQGLVMLPLAGTQGRSWDGVGGSAWGCGATPSRATAVPRAGLLCAPCASASQQLARAPCSALPEPCRALFGRSEAAGASGGAVPANPGGTAGGSRVARSSRQGAVPAEGPAARWQRGCARVGARPLPAVACRQCRCMPGARRVPPCSRLAVYLGHSCAKHKDFGRRPGALAFLGVESAPANAA